MRKTYLLAAALLGVLFSSCEEWEPVLTVKYDEVPAEKPKVKLVTTSIAELKSMYAGKPLDIQEDLVIGGQVISDDTAGNIYRSLFIQDYSGAIEVKIGKSSLYSDYKVGQWVYVCLSGLTLGNYNGTLQIGAKDPSGEYETAYIDVQSIIDTHIFRGDIDPPVKPVELAEADLVACLAKGYRGEYFGRLVTLRGLKYGAVSTYSTDAYKRIFALLYIDQYADKKASSNRIFLSDKTYGVTTWAMSKNKFLEYFDAGNFDNVYVGNGNSKTPATPEQLATLRANAVSITLSQYFSLGRTPVQIRTSGYAKFADKEIDPAVLGDISSSYVDGASIDVTGILSNYDNAIQFTLIDENSVVVNR